MSAFAIKAEITDPKAKTFVFRPEDDVCGMNIAEGDLIFLFASAGRHQSELNLRFYRQATNKIVGLSDDASVFLDSFF